LKRAGREEHETIPYPHIKTPLVEIQPEGVLLVKGFIDRDGHQHIRLGSREKNKCEQ
jgi:hypothetical protein